MRIKWFIGVILLAHATLGEACTNLIVGKKASADGSVIVSYSADDFGSFGFLRHFAAGKHAAGSTRSIYNWETNNYAGEIEEASETYNVIGNMNEYQLTITETTFGGRPELVDSTGLLDYGSLIYVTLQRAKTAREAIGVMTGLIERYGYNSGGESFTIADKNEAWVMDLIGKGPGRKGAVWVAVRVPDDCICAHANQSRIRRFPLQDKENCLYADDVVSFAREKGYYKGTDSDFSFCEAYAPADFSALRFCEARVWSFFNRYVKGMDKYLPYASGADPTAPPMPLFVRPDKPVSVQDVKEMMRDHYEGTPFALDNDPGMGPFEAPYRPTPLMWETDGKTYFNERPISTQQSAFVMVAQMRSQLPDYVGGVLWFGCDDANMIAFTPVYCCTDKVPVSYTRVDGADYITFSWNSAFWLFNWVANMVYPRYDLMIDDVRSVQNELETMFAQAQAGIESAALKLHEKDQAQAKAFLTSYTNQMAQSTVDAWKRLGEFLIVKYNDGVVKRVKDGKFERNAIGQPAGVIRPGYPKDFLEEYVKQTGDRYKMPE